MDRATIKWIHRINLGEVLVVDNELVECMDIVMYGPLPYRGPLPIQLLCTLHALVDITIESSFIYFENAHSAI